MIETWSHGRSRRRLLKGKIEYEKTFTYDLDYRSSRSGISSRIGASSRRRLGRTWLGRWWLASPWLAWRRMGSGCRPRNPWCWRRRSPCCSLLPPAMLGSARQLGSLRSGLPISQTTDGGEGLRPPPSLQHKAEKRGDSIPRVLPLPRLELTRTSRSKRTNLRRSQMETSKS
jgi:hypothetical protein